jgi:hypothetical protein
MVHRDDQREHGAHAAPGAYGVQVSVVCPSCGATARTVQNPFYGSGMAVHERLIDCGTCNRVTIDKNPPGDRAGLAARTSVKRRSLIRGWFSRRRS